jgi:hypothetical protein
METDALRLEEQPKHPTMIAAGESVCAIDHLLAKQESARHRDNELCLFSKNCGNGRAWLAYSTNCQA